MSKYSLAVELAEQLGRNLDEAKRFVDEIGPDAARKVADDLNRGANETVSLSDNAASSIPKPGPWTNRAIATGGVAGATGVGLNYTKAMQTEAAAKKAKAQNKNLKTRREWYNQVMNSDLPAKTKRKYAFTLLGGANNKNGGGGGGNNSGGLFSGLFSGGGGGGGGGLFGGDLKMVLGLLVVLALLTSLGGGE